MGLLRADLLKLTRHGLLLWLSLALLVLVLLRTVVWPPDPALPWSGLWSVHLVAAAVLVLAAISVGLEFGDDTLRSLAGRGVSRGALLLAHFAALVLAAGLLLLAAEGLATLLGVRPRLQWAALGRAWLSLWPYAAFSLLLAVLSRNGGLALAVSTLWLAAEQLLGLLLGPIAFLGESLFFRVLSPDGLLMRLYLWSLGYNGANWTYLGHGLQAPSPANLLLLARPRPALHSGLLLAGYVGVALGLALLVVYRRDLAETAAGETRWLRLPGRLAPVRQDGDDSRRVRAARLPAGGSGGPALVRLVRAYLFTVAHTSLLRLGAVVVVLFPLALWGMGRALGDATFERLMFGRGPAGQAPLVVGLSLMVVGPLAATIGSLGVSYELSLGTRRSALSRGVTRLQAVAGHGLALALSVGALFGLQTALLALLGAALDASALRAVGVAFLAAGAYTGAAQVGAALTRSPLGTLVFGLGLFLADWLGILVPLPASTGSGLLDVLGHCGLFANSFFLAVGEVQAMGTAWQHLEPAGAFLLLLVTAASTHLLAAALARWRGERL